MSPLIYENSIITLKSHPSQRNHRRLYVCDSTRCNIRDRWKKESQCCDPKYLSSRREEEITKIHIKQQQQSVAKNYKNNDSYSNYNNSRDSNKIVYLTNYELVSQWVIIMITIINALFNNSVIIHTSSAAKSPSIPLPGGGGSGIVHQFRPSFRSMLNSLHPTATNDKLSTTNRLVSFWLNPAVFLSTPNKKHQQQSHDSQYAFNKYSSNSLLPGSGDGLTQNQDQSIGTGHFRSFPIYQRQQPSTNALWTSLDVDSGSQTSFPETLMLDGTEIDSLDVNHNTYQPQPILYSPSNSKRINFSLHQTTIRPITTTISSPMIAPTIASTIGGLNNSKETTRLVIKHPESCSYHRSQPACAFNLLCYLASGIPVEGCLDQQPNDHSKNSNSINSHETCCYIYPGGINSKNQSRLATTDNYQQLSQLVLKSSVSLAPESSTGNDSSSPSARVKFFADLMQTNRSNDNQLNLNNNNSNNNSEQFLSSASSTRDSVSLPLPGVDGSTISSNNMDAITQPIVYPIGQSYSPTRRHQQQNKRTSRRFAPSGNLNGTAPMFSAPVINNLSQSGYIVSQQSQSIPGLVSRLASQIIDNQVEIRSPDSPINQETSDSNRFSKYITDHNVQLNQMFRMKLNHLNQQPQHQQQQQQQQEHQNILREDNVGDTSVYGEPNSQNSLLFNNLFAGSGASSKYKKHIGSKKQLDGGQQTGWVANDLRFLTDPNNSSNNGQPFWPNQVHHQSSLNDQLFFPGSNTNNKENGKFMNGGSTRADHPVAGGPIMDSTSLMPMTINAPATTATNNNHHYHLNHTTIKRLHHHNQQQQQQQQHQHQQIFPVSAGYKVARQRSLNLTAAYPSTNTLEPSYLASSSSSSYTLDNSNSKNNQQQQQQNNYQLEQQDPYLSSFQALVDTSNISSSTIFMPNTNSNNNNNNNNGFSNKNDNLADQLITLSGGGIRSPTSASAATTATNTLGQQQTNQTPPVLSFAASLNHTQTDNVLSDGGKIIANGVGGSLSSPNNQRQEDSLYYQIVQTNQPSLIHQLESSQQQQQANFKSIPQQLLIPSVSSHISQNSQKQQLLQHQQQNLHGGQHLIFTDNNNRQQSTSSSHDHDISASMDTGQPRSSALANNHSPQQLASLAAISADHQHGNSLHFSQLTSSTTAPRQQQVSEVSSFSSINHQQYAQQEPSLSQVSQLASTSATSSDAKNNLINAPIQPVNNINQGMHSQHHAANGKASSLSSGKHLGINHSSNHYSHNHNHNNHNHNLNHNHHHHHQTSNSNGGSNSHHQSASSAAAAVVSSSLSTVLDVFGAASQYLMRFRPTSLISPTTSSSSTNHLKSLTTNFATTTSPVIPLPLSASSANLISSLHKSSLASDQNSLTKYNQYNQRRDDVCGRTVETPQRRIIGGEGARFGEFPYQVHIKIAKHQCGGALVDRQSIVTAAHCVYHFISRAPVSKLQIVIGAYDIEDEQYQELPPQYFKVNKVKLHPSFRFSASHPDRYDIAILKLDKPVKYTDNVLPVCLPPQDFKFESMIGTVTGFGKTDPSLSNRYGTRLLQKVDVPIIENAECERWHRTRGIDLKIFPEMMCAGYEDGLKDACVGDSGGPLVVRIPVGPNGAHRWTLAGITSAGFGCAQSRQPGIYHRVSHTVDWIIENLD